MTNPITNRDCRFESICTERENIAAHPQDISKELTQELTTAAFYAMPERVVYITGKIAMAYRLGAITNAEYIKLLKAARETEYITRAVIE